MPFKPAPTSEIPIGKYIPSDVQKDDPSAVDIAQALWRTENTIGSYLNQAEGLPDSVDDRSFNPYDFFTEEEKADSQFVVNAALADSEDEINAVRRQQSRERKDRQTIADGGALSFALGFGVGVVDPINFIPIGGAIAKTYKTGSSVLRSAAVTGSVTAATTAVQEAALHSTQLERTYGESAVNVGAAAFLGGALGFGVGKLSKYIDEKQIKEIANSMDVEPRILAGEDSVILSNPEGATTVISREGQPDEVITQTAEELRAAQRSAEDIAIEQEISIQSRMADDYAEAMAASKVDSDEFTIALEKSKDTLLREISKEMTDVNKQAMFGRLISEYGGLNQKAWNAEAGLNKKDSGSLKGGFQKPFWRSGDSGLTPDQLAEKLSEDNLVPEISIGAGYDMSDAIKLVDDLLATGDRFVDPDVEARLVRLQEDEAMLARTVDENIDEVYGEAFAKLSAQDQIDSRLAVEAADIDAIARAVEIEDMPYFEVTPSLQKQAEDEGISARDLSVGAAQVANGEEVTGKVGKFLVKALSFDPLSRTITSQNPIVRTLANQLAENPIAMDRGGITAVESRIKIKDGRYAAALQSHLDQFRLYKKNGGTLNRVKFNEAVARALRNDESDIPEAIASAKTWRSELYDPLKNEAIEVGLLPEDVDVGTAVGYLNRRWNKNKIVDNYGEFLSVVSKWLKDKDIALRIEAEKARVELETLDAAELPVPEVKAETITENIVNGVLQKEIRLQSDAGSISARIDGDTMTIIGVKIDEGKRGVGEGRNLYLSLIDAAKRQNVKTILSDETVEIGAVRIYDSLARRGVKVEKSPSFKLMDSLFGEPVKVKVVDAEAANDLISEISEFSKITDDGLVTVYHRTTAENAKQIRDSGTMTPKEDGLFFSTSTKGQAEGFGDEVIEMQVPADRLLLDDLFDAEAHLRLPAIANKPNSIKEYLLPDKFATAKDQPFTITVPRVSGDRAKLQKVIDKAEFKEQLDIEDMEYEDIARQIAQRIKGSPDGRLPYDWKIGEGSGPGKLNGTPMRGPLRSRTFQIPDNLIDDFLDNDIEDLGRVYLRQIAPDIELKRQFDDIEMTEEFAQVELWYSEAMKKAKTTRERDRLEKAKNSDIEDLAGMRDRIRGVYAMEDMNNIFHRAGRVARNLNYLSLMGGVVASSVPDVARIFMAEGISKTFSKGIAPLAKNLKNFKVSAAEGKAYGIGVDALMGGRSQIISDIADYTKAGTAFERGVQSLTDNFGRLNLMDYWTAGVKQLHVVTMQNSVIDGLLKGKIDKRLSRLGIDDANATAIGGQLKKYAEKVDGVWLSNARNWDNPALEQIWGAALRKESDRVIVVPGQEKPLFMSTPMGKTIMQFRSFMFASTQRMTIAAVQGQDHNALGGVLMLTTLGMMSYAFKQKDAGREITDDPIALLIEGIDRSGSLGAIMEINNTMEKVSSNNFGLRPLLGVDLPAARFASRSIADGIMGPTFGSSIGLVARVANAGLGEDDWTESDTRALRRLLPGQNLTFIRNGLDRVEKEIGDL